MYKGYVKRILDFIFAIVLFCICIMPMLVVFLLIKFSSKGSAIFKQERLGKDNKKFYIYKFRTMELENEKNDLKLNDYERITKIGKWLRQLSLDELPQILNVIKGEMSFIGPRPLYVHYLELYNNHQKRRHEVLPGISGWAQISGRNSLEWNEKFNYDVEYVDNISFLFDLKILIYTFRIVLLKKGVNRSESLTMEMFQGDK